jgi:hypothetical protein
LNFRSFLEYDQVRISAPSLGNTVGTHNDMATGAYLPAAVSGSEMPQIDWPSDRMGSTDLIIHSVERQSRVKEILNAATYVYKDKKRHNDMSNRDSVIIRLWDNTTVEMPVHRYDQLYKSGKKIVPGSMIKVSFIRNPLDNSNKPSEVSGIEVQD